MEFDEIKHNISYLYRHKQLINNIDVNPHLSLTLSFITTVKKGGKNKTIFLLTDTDKPKER